MARTVRDSKLDSRTARLKLERGARHWRQITDGLTLVYRRTESGYGTWSARFLDQETGRRVLVRLGVADDHQEPDGVDVLTFAQAQQKAMNDAHRIAISRQGTSYSVADAMRDYLEWYSVNNKPAGYKTARYVADAHVLPELGSIILTELTADTLRRWHRSVAIAEPRVRSPRHGALKTRDGTADPRARKATANRILTVLKAALNHAYTNERARNFDAWRSVKPFKDVDAPKVRHLTEDDARRLVNASTPDFRQLVQAALLTGCRYGELCSVTAGDLNISAGSVYVRETKNGKPRHVPLTDDGLIFFEQIAAGKDATTLLFTRADGDPWKQGHQHRPIKEACTRASIAPAISFHILRHTYGSSLAMKGVPLQVIAAALGHTDTRVTERHYAHLRPSYIADTIRANLPTLGIVTPSNVAPIGRERNAATKKSGAGAMSSNEILPITYDR